MSIIANIYTWPCGTPRSQGNAFTAHLVAPTPIKALTAKEKAKAYQREYAKTRYVTAAERNAAATAFSKFHSHNFAANKTPSKTIHRATGAMRTAE